MNKNVILSAIKNSQKNIDEFIGRWKQKSFNDENIFDKFISFYIGHNALVNNFYDFKERLVEGNEKIKKDSYKMKDFVIKQFNKGEMEKIVSSQKMKDNIEVIKNIINEGEYIYNFDRLAAESHNFYYKKKIKENKLKLSSLDDKEYLDDLNSESYESVFKAIVKIIYKVRCNLFHGDKKFVTNGKQERNIKVALNCLKEINHSVTQKWNEFIKELIEKIEKENLS
ncbi:MAG: hypothetical protein ISS16_04405 [Ignavibacteria bacterium]|nr:hypothetical protein [Bacteroidota bacterium]MBL7128208.1 hypothetical protein [Ignavibacteria bacterium]